MSIWDYSSKTNRKIKELKEDITVDTLIIGGGLSGLNLAYYLKDKDNVCLVEGNIIGHGVTLRSTAKINYFQECIYTDIIKSSNYDNACSYLKSQLLAIKELKNIIENGKIDCDFKRVDSYVFANSSDEVDRLKEEIKFLKENNIDVKKKKLKLDVEVHDSYYVSDTYIFNPIKYLNDLYNILKDKIDIYENTKIINIEKEEDKYICYTNNNHKIICNNVIFMCHYPYFTIPYLTPIKCSIEKSYMIVSKVKKEEDYTCINTNYPIYSKRYYSDGENIYQISLAKSNKLNKVKDEKYFFDRVKEIFKLKEKDIVMKYSNSDIMTPDHMPYIGKIKENMYISIGYNTWGMTNSVLGAYIINDLLNNKENEYVDVFNPNRVDMVSFIGYMFENIVSFVENKIIKNKDYYSDNVKFIEEYGNSIGVYTDKEGKEYKVYNKCPHLGCSLNFNEVEKTWDCPCHSSRFDLNGKCIKGPALKDITYKSNCD